MITKKNKKIEDMYILLCMLMLGADMISIRISGLTIRLVQILLVVLAVIYMLCNLYKMNIKVGLFYMPIIIVHSCSILTSYDMKQSLLFTIWIVYTLLFVIYTFYSWAIRRSIDEIIMIYMKSYRIVGYLTILHFVLITVGIYIPFIKNDIYMGIARPSVWFYEPSYLATYFSFYYGMALYIYVSSRDYRYRKDLVLSILFIMFTTSTTGYLAIAVGIAIILVYNILRFVFTLKIEKVKFKKYLTIIILIIIGLVLISIINPDILTVFIGRLFKDGLAKSSGARISDYNLLFSIFKDHPIIGVGAGAYETYANVSYPPTNVTLEILCTTGILGFSSFILFGIFVYICQIKSKNIYVKAMGFALLIFIIILQANQNYLRIYMWAHIGVYLAIIFKKSKGYSYIS